MNSKRFILQSRVSLALQKSKGKWKRSENDSIPVIASSGAGKVEHFSEVFQKTDVEAALAAGIFHREEVPIEAVKEHMRDEGIETR